MSDDLDQLSRALANLGAESRTARRVRTVAPWLVSLALHITVIVLALAITYTVTHLPANPDDGILITADFNALNYTPVVGSNDAVTQVTGPIVRDLAQPLPVGEQVADQLRSGEATPAIDVAAALGHAGGSDPAGGLSSFAPKAGPISATFAGVTGSNARRIVYVIDASGSMISSFQIVIDELSRSLANLSPQQSFSVIFFQENHAIEAPPAGRLSPASLEDRGRALKWISANVVPRGGTNPLVAIEKALTLKPDVIFLLSQDITGYGEFELDQKELMATLDRLNPRNASSGRRLTQINCIQFLDPDPLDTMSIIAKEHGGPGGYKFLSRKDLGLGASP